jgi:membrane protease YdiL (CAAX protease family)
MPLALGLTDKKKPRFTHLLFHFKKNPTAQLMFNRYWRTYPWLMQFFLLTMLMFSIWSLFTILLQVIAPRMYGVSFADLLQISSASSPRMIRGALLMQCIFTLGLFGLPAFLFAHLTHPNPVAYIGFRKPGKPAHWGITLLIMIGAVPTFLGLESVMHLLPLGASAERMQAQNEQIINAYLSLPSFPDFLYVFFTMALMPAICEEMLFRGVLFRLVAKSARRIIWPILISAAFFALVHTSAYGLPAIFAAGILLAVIYYFTGSLGCSIGAHLLNNGLQIIWVYLAKHIPALNRLVNSGQLPWYLPTIGLIILTIGLYLLWKNRTAIPDNWPQDYTEAELAEKA